MPLSITRRLTFARFALVLVVADVRAGAQTSGAQAARAHHHPPVSRRLAIDDSVPEFAMVAMKAPPRAKRGQLVVAPGERYEAFVVADTQLVVMDRRRRRAWSIRGIPLEWRDFTALSWVDGRTLTFDRWANPHAGMHYVVDVAARRLTGAMSFHDRALDR
jgi:hypothetical protein